MKKGYPIGVPIWVLQKNPYLSRLLTILLRQSIIKPINNQNCQKPHGFRVKIKKKKNKNIKQNLLQGF